MWNHEREHIDMFDATVFDKDEKDFLMKFWDIYSKFLEPEQVKQFYQSWFYSAKYKNTNLRIISMNSFLCDALNFYLIKNPTDPLGQMARFE